MEDRHYQLNRAYINFWWSQHNSSLHICSSGKFKPRIKKRWRGWKPKSRKIIAPIFALVSLLCMPTSLPRTSFKTLVLRPNPGYHFIYHSYPQLAKYDNWIIISNPQAHRFMGLFALQSHRTIRQDRLFSHRQAPKTRFILPIFLVFLLKGHTQLIHRMCRPGKTMGPNESATNLLWHAFMDGEVNISIPVLWGV